MVKEIELTQGYVALVDDEDYERVNQYKWWTNKQLYERICASSKFRKVGGGRYNVYMHRFILKITDRKVMLDHINMNTLDNRKSNLRIANYCQNKCNTRSHKDSFSKYKGVSWYTKQQIYRCEIMSKGKVYRLGRFKDEIQAAKAYDKAAKELHGEFARLNFE